MNRYFKIGAMAILAVMLSASIGYSASNNWGNTDTYQLLGKVAPSYLVLAGTDQGATSTTVASGTAVIPVTGYALVTKTIGEGAGTVCTVANGAKGQILVIRAGTVTGSSTAVITPATCSGFSTVTLAYEKQTVTLLYIDDTIGWIIIGTGGIVTSGAPVIA